MPYKDPVDNQAYRDRTRNHRREVYHAWARAHRPERRQYQKEWLKNNPAIAEKQRQYNRDHRTAFSAKRRATFLALSPEEQEVLRQKDRNYARARRAANPEKARAKDHERRQKHGAHIDAMTRARRAANPEPFRQTDRKRDQKPQRRAQLQAHTREHRAAKNGALLNDLTHPQWLEIQAAQDHRCYYCGKRCKGKLTQDHIQPLSQGGNHTLHNVIAACKSCNSRKGTRPPPIPVQPLLLTIAEAKKAKKAS